MFVRLSQALTRRFVLRGIAVLSGGTAAASVASAAHDGPAFAFWGRSATVEEKAGWDGDGVRYLGGDWAEDLFKSALTDLKSDTMTADSRRGTRERMVGLTTQLQASIINALEALEAEAAGETEDPARFRVDVDDRREQGKLGVTAVIQKGRVVEKAGVGVTMLSKPMNPRMAKQMSANHPGLQEAIERVGVEGLTMWVSGISCIVHPVNPHAPTVHFNYRHFVINDKDGKQVAWWFGGGQDLTPIYLYEQDAAAMHQRLRSACDQHDVNYYPRFKAWADRYFYHKARKEARGIGGIFFDDLDQGNREDVCAFVEDCAAAFIPSYMPILQGRSQEPYTEEQKEWQALRHGRYVEFNLVYDRGTKFGFTVPNVKIESVLMSLPLTVRFEYKNEPEKGSAERLLLDTLCGPPRDWA